MAGGGTALRQRHPRRGEDWIAELEGDEKTGAAASSLKALEEPVRQIAANAGIEGSVVVEKLKKAGKVGYGYDAYNGESTAT